MKMLPIKGEVNVTINEYDNQGLGIGGTISGVFSHFGKLKESESTWHCERHSFDAPLLYYAHHLEACTANGDYVYGTYSGSINIETLEANAIWDINGGTGKFKKISGYMKVQGYAQRDKTGHTTGSSLIGNGEISNIGSNK